MLKKLSHIAFAATLGVAVLAFHVDDASARPPLSRDDYQSEFGGGTYREYRSNPYFYDSPRLLHGSQVGSTAGFRVYDDAPARYPYRTSRYRYYRDGYWYATPVGLLTAPLTLPLAVATAPFRAVAGEPVFGRGRHVDWCSARYRSYNPATNTWVSARGVVRRCISPYS